MTRVILVLATMLWGPVSVVAAQGAETLYGAGSFRLAADSFAARAKAAPEVPTNWYNLGNALFRAGDDVGARAAWIRAARALPRNREVRQAVNLVQAPDVASANATVIPLFTPGEVLALAIAIWIAGWTLAAFRRSWRQVMPLLLAAVLVGILGWSKAHEYDKPIALVRHANTALRLAPFASAATRRSLNDGTTVEVVRSYAGWVFVRRGGEEGWLQRSEIVPLTGTGT